MGEGMAGWRDEPNPLSPFPPPSLHCQRCYRALSGFNHINGARMFDATIACVTQGQQNRAVAPRTLPSSSLFVAQRSKRRSLLGLRSLPHAHV